MSWLLVVCIPGLLMLATFGLSRLETRLDTSSETVTAADVAAMLKTALAKTKSACAPPPATDRVLARRAGLFDEPLALPQRDPSLDVSNYTLPCTAPSTATTDRFPKVSLERDSAGPLPTRHRGNPQFRQTRQANRV